MTHWLYKIRMVKGGPWVPCKVWFGPPADPVTGEPLDRSPRWHCLLNGVLLDDPFKVIMLIGDQDPIVKGEPISELDYKHMLAVKDWAVEYAPDEPEAKPTKRVDLNKMPPIKFA